MTSKKGGSQFNRSFFNFLCMLPHISGIYPIYLIRKIIFAFNRVEYPCGPIENGLKSGQGTSHPYQTTE